MIATAKKKPSSAFPRQKIVRAIEHVLPRGKEFKLHVQDSMIGRLKIVRVVTPAWKHLRPWQRIGKIRNAIEGTLSSTEQGAILRFSVLTPEEYKSLVLDSPVLRRVRPIGAKKLAAKRKAARKPKATLAK